MNAKANWRAVEDTQHVVPGLTFPDTMPVPYWTEQVLTDEQCDAVYHEVIKNYPNKALSLVYSADGTGSQVDLEARYTHYYNPAMVNPGGEVERAFNEGINRAVRQLWNASAHPVYPAQVLGYEERCKFVTHCDNSIPVNGQWVRNDKERDITGLLYITEQVDRVTKPGQFSGGSLVLDNLVDDSGPITIRPRKGQLVMFPSHPVFRHQVPQVTGGYRIAFVNWWTVR